MVKQFRKVTAVGLTAFMTISMAYTPTLSAFAAENFTAESNLTYSGEAQTLFSAGSVDASNSGTIYYEAQISTEDAPSKPEISAFEGSEVWLSSATELKGTDLLPRQHILMSTDIITGQPR